MDDWDKSWLGEGYSYKYPCNYCDGHHVEIECPICHICGGQYVHWSGCPNSYSHPSNPYYDSSVICDVGRGDEVENVEQEVHNIFLKQFMNMVDKSNLAQRELQSKLTELESMMMEKRAKDMKLQAIIMELQAKVDADQFASYRPS
uniref:Uncharacterized protein n=1 Tax=Solanum tuberosum TaxID=4113 RepID=M1DDE9_SOLTU